MVLRQIFQEVDISGIDPTSRITQIHPQLSSRWYRWKTIANSCNIFGITPQLARRSFFSKSWLADVGCASVVVNVLKAIKLSLHKHGLDHVNIIIAGGAVRDLLFECPNPTKDFDIFFINVKDKKELLKLSFLDTYLPPTYGYDSFVNKYLPYGFLNMDLNLPSDPPLAKNNQLFKKCTVHGEGKEVHFDFVLGQENLFQTMMLFDWYECMWAMSFEDNLAIGYREAKEYLLFIRPKWDALCNYTDTNSRYNKNRLNLNIGGCHNYTEVLTRGLYNAKRINKPMKHKDFLTLSTLINLEISNGNFRTIRP